MQFLLVARDGKDGNALDRRLAVREAHLALGRQLSAEGKMLYGVALLDERERMVGSMLVLDFPTRAELDEWLVTEPYVTGDVWREVHVEPCRVGAAFLPRPAAP